MFSVVRRSLPMSEARSRSNKTLGQRIDAVLQPLYEEADQHRASLDLIKAQMQSLQEQADQANAGLALIESRMAEVVRALATQEPVIAAAFSSAPATKQAETTPAPAAKSSPAPAAVALPASTPAPAAVVAPVIEPATVALSEVVPLDLEPEIDQAMVDEASQLLASAPSDQAEPEVESAAAALQSPSAQDPAEESVEGLADETVAVEAPPVDIASVAQRAAAAAKLLREKSAMPSK